MSNEPDDESGFPPQLAGMIRAAMDSNKRVTDQREREALKRDRIYQGFRTGINSLTDGLDGISEREALAAFQDFVKFNDGLIEAMAGHNHRVRDVLADSFTELVEWMRNSPDCPCVACVEGAEEEADLDTN